MGSIEIQYTCSCIGGNLSTLWRRTWFRTKESWIDTEVSWAIPINFSILETPSKEISGVPERPHRAVPRISGIFFQDNIRALLPCSSNSSWYSSHTMRWNLRNGNALAKTLNRLKCTTTSPTMDSTYQISWCVVLPECELHNEIIGTHWDDASMIFQHRLNKYRAPYKSVQRIDYKASIWVSPFWNRPM